ncbi:SOS response-associated peptidase [Comamonas testosteroni]|uniref:SOS response-associated peptidase n=1 Tax=Comamonas testosteroni TaxID=285 RepID=UPI00265F3451|nr:SOS response-associated peptidase family protein [Comamonas testosteroni]WKL17911.1 SOS response-associated peptidase family protein [Comamonas testosteroni]WQD43154.1 SOS response-associated peptidase family protein [Comamonas testosteroni]
MSSCHLSLAKPEFYLQNFRVEAPESLPEAVLTPRRMGLIIVNAAAESSAALLGQPFAAPEEGAPALPVERVLVPASFGLVPHWVKSASDGRLRALKLVTAKIDNLTTGTAFRDAWLAGQRCIVPMQAFQVDDLRPGKPLPTRITRVDNQPMGAAGVWARWVGEDGEVIVSYALITINANAHALMNRYGQPGNDKAMPAILNEGAYDAWLNAKVNKAKEFLRPYPAEKLRANPVEKGRKQPPPLL